MTLATEWVDLQNEEENSLICEACGFKLEARACKLRCLRCGYFRSCSDLF